MDLMHVIGVVAAFFSTFSQTPQVIKTIRTRETAGVAPLMFLMTITASVLWVNYGVMKSDWIIVIGNTLGFFMAMPVFVIAIYNRIAHKKE